MPLVAEVLELLTLVVVFVLLPFLLITALLLLSRRYRGMFDHIGLARQEIGLLLFGSLAASLVAIDVPVLVTGRHLLAVNVAGALIPAVLAVHLLWSKRIHVVAWLFGIAFVALVTFFVTRVEPALGIVAEFPWLFLPSLSAALLSLAIYSKNSPKAPGFAYATATLGSLIGADVLRLPELLRLEAFAGSIGGAGVYDLVYLAGLISLVFVLFIAMGGLRHLRASLRPSEVAHNALGEELEASVRAFRAGNHHVSVQRTLVAVQVRMHQLARSAIDRLDELIPRWLPDAGSQRAYRALMEVADRPDADPETARWAMYQGQFVLRSLDDAQHRRYASVGLRMGAFAVDGAVMSVALVGVALSFLSLGSEGLTDLHVLALLFWAWSIQMVYFTLLEYFAKGRTLGKWIFGIRVVTIDGRPPNFITSFARNVVRMLDFALLLYLVSIMAMLATRRVQRIGDLVADTVVVRGRPAPTPSAALSIGQRS